MPKSNGGHRLIIDLSLLNNFVVKTSFRMEDRNTITSLISPNDFMVSIDLCNAFHSISLHPSSKNLVVFEFENQRYNFNVIPFGLTSAPRVFTKVLRPAIAYLRSRGIKISAYLDDIFICNSSFDSTLSDLNFSLSLLESLGFSVNKSKSVFVPTQRLLHLGYIFDSKISCLCLPEVKLVKIKSLISLCLDGPQTLRTYSNLLGLLVSSKNAFKFAPLFYRKFQLCFLEGLKKCFSWDSIWLLNSEAITDLSWWSSCSLSDITPYCFIPPKTDLVLFTDASLSGWGASLSSGEYFSGFWSNEESNLHINLLELKAVFLAVSHFIPFISGKDISIKCDNSTAIAYINNFGGTHSKLLCYVALEFWFFLMENSINCSASHIAGIDNNTADYLSRHSHLHEYELSKDAFSFIISYICFPLHIDLFASKQNKKLETYCSMFADQSCLHIDAFSFIWPSFVYIFPPIPLISRALLKVFRDNVDYCLFITPAWHSLPVIPILTKSLVDNPIYISSIHLLGCLPTKSPFSLMAWPISTSSVKTKGFQLLCQTLYSKASDQVPSNLISDFGNSLLHGLIQNKITPKLLQK